MPARSPDAACPGLRIGLELSEENRHWQSKTEPIAYTSDTEAYPKLLENLMLGLKRFRQLDLRGKKRAKS